MKIIKNNFKEEDIAKQIICSHCNSVLEVTKKDIQIYIDYTSSPFGTYKYIEPILDDRFDEYYTFIKCACCGGRIRNPKL